MVVADEAIILFVCKALADAGLDVLEGNTRASMCLKAQHADEAVSGLHPRPGDIRAMFTDIGLRYKSELIFTGLVWRYSARFRP